MDDTCAITALAALAQPTRLAVFRRLVRAFPANVAAGDIARGLGVRHNTMSTHLAVLARAELIAAARDGRAIRYRADLEGFRELVAFLTQDCCGGREEICAPLLDVLASSDDAANPEAGHARHHI